MPWWSRGPRAAWRLLRLTIEAFLEDHASLMAAALSFYTLISIAPLMIILLSVAASIYGPEVVQGSASRGMTTILGTDVSDLLEALIDSAALAGTRWAVSLLGLGVVVYGATRVFSELQRALRVIWRDPEKPPPGFHPLLMIKTYLASYLMVIAFGALWFVGIFSATIIAAVETWMTDRLPEELRLASITHTVASIALITIAVALVYRFLSGGRAYWTDVWIGAGLTAALITIGQKLIGTYLGFKTISSVYGAAGSLVLVLFWFYYTWWIFFLGAEFTKVYATEFRKRKPRRR